MSAVPLRRNRDFFLLQSGQLLSSIGTQSSSIAYPLLVLALTHSPAKAGLVSFARIVPSAALLLPAGLLVDRYDRKRMMITADLIRMAAIGTLAAALLAHDVAFWLIAIVAFVEGTGTALFSGSEVSAVRAVVPPEQLPTATSVITGRSGAVRLAGPPTGGVLFGLGRAIPFVADVASYAFSTASLLLMRTPFQEEREPEHTPIRSQLAEGIRFVRADRFLRTLACLFGLTNFLGPGLLLVLVVLAKRHGLTSGEVGGLVAVFAASMIVGATMTGFVRSILPTRGVLLLEVWAWTGCALFLVWPSVYVLTATLVPVGLAIPTTDSVAVPYWLRLTPDRLMGRVQSVVGTLSFAVAPFGPLAAGLLLANASPRATVAVFAAVALALALWGTLSPAIRAAPKLEG